MGHRGTRRRRFARRAPLLFSTVLALCLAAVWSGPHTQAAPRQAAPAAAEAAHRATLDRYCLTCHTQRLKNQGTVPISLEGLDLARVGADAQVWEKVVLKLRAGLMPPASSPRPDKATHDALASWLEAELDRASSANLNPGRTEPIHRLNRAEYRNAVRDLLDLDGDVAALLPADDVSYGFDNIAGVLKISPTLMERYLTAAQKVSRLAIGTPLPVPAIDYYRVADDLSQDEHLPGLPLGSRGGTFIRYTFPMDGVYEFRPRLTRDLNESMPVYTEDQLLEISIDGERVGLFTLPGVAGAASAQPPEDPDNPSEPPAQPASAPAPRPGGQGQPARPAISQIQQTVRASAKERAARNRADEAWNLRVPVKAGARDVVVTFLNRVSALDETARLPFERPYPAGVNIPETRLGAYLRSVEISGPHDATGPGNAPSRQRIFVCHPSSSRASAPAAAAEKTCARQILSTLARRAYRRPAAAADVDALIAFFDEGRAQGGFDMGIEHALRRLLAY